jgi:hypothetical protein
MKRRKQRKQAAHLSRDQRHGERNTAQRKKADKRKHAARMKLIDERRMRTLASNTVGSLKDLMTGFQKVQAPKT